MIKRLSIVLIIALISLRLSGCAALYPVEKTTEQRLAVFPQQHVQLSQPVDIYWNDYQVPFIVAQSDADLAFSLGLVHAHLRGMQLNFLKRVSQGRISEMVGPFAVDIDHALRVIDFERGAKASLAVLKPETRHWLERFVAGINAYFAQNPQPSPESGLMNLPIETFTVTDILTIGRLAGTDVNWLAYFGLLQARKAEPEKWPQLWQQALAQGMSGATSFVAEPKLQQLGQLLSGLSRSGSNSVVLAPQKSTLNTAMLANDPHLGLVVPNLWLLVGVKSPSYHFVGMMIPGLPFAGLGRNPQLAWGGTNMRSASSDLYRVNDIPEAQIDTQTETIKVRGWFDEQVSLRRTPWGGMLSDVAIFPANEDEMLALKWAGHEASDEISAFLQANRAESVAEFQAAFTDYAVSGQNLLAVDDQGNIGMTLAVALPQRQYQWPADLILDATNPAEQWQGYLNADALPKAFNPEVGFIASANNPPVAHDPAIGFFFNPDERVRRLQALLAQKEKLSLTDLQQLQTDVYSPAAHHLAKTWRQLFALELEQADSAIAAEIKSALQTWDGHYSADSRAALLFEAFSFGLLKAYVGEDLEDKLYYQQWNYVCCYLQQDLAALTNAQRQQLVTEALAISAEIAEEFSNWGAKHRVKVRHVLANLPVIGSSFEFDDYPASGSRETVLKANHGFSAEQSSANYGSQSRHISLMHDVDANYFVLFGGQDGWLGSENFVDQIPLWKSGDYLQLPLRLERVQAEFRHHLRLQAAP